MRDAERDESKTDSPQILHEIANGTRDLFSFVKGKWYDRLHRSRFH